MKNLKMKLKKMYLKTLKALVKRKWDKARNLNIKMIDLELEIKREEASAKQKVID